MFLVDLPICLVLAGLTAYVVLGGADFGAGAWTLLAGRDRPDEVREHAHRALAAVWEANHVWLIFVLVVTWTAYPGAFGSIASTLAVPLFVAAVGIILRGSTYVLRSAAGLSRLGFGADVVFAVSSILTPFALGAAAGGIASGRVPIGNASGSLVTSWLNPTSALVGGMAVVTGAYLAAVYLAADARRRGSAELEALFRTRALGAGLVAGAVAAGGLAVVRFDAPRLWHGLVHGGGLACLVASGLCGAATLALVARSRFEPARLTAAGAVAAIVIGWALAQRPLLLPPSLTIREAAAGHATLVAVAVTAGIAAVLLLPSLGLLYTLVLRGRFDPDVTAVGPGAVAVATAPLLTPTRLAAVATVVLLVVGAALTVFAGASWAHGIGVASLLAFVAVGFRLLALPES